VNDSVVRRALIRGPPLQSHPSDSPADIPAQTNTILDFVPEVNGDEGVLTWCFDVQDDILHEDLTVRENLAYSAWLRSNVAMVSEAKGEVVEEVVDLLQLRHVQVTPNFRTEGLV